MSKARKLTRASLCAHPLPDPCRTRSKEDRGQVLIVGGSRQVPGAVLLAAIAAMRAGAGKLQVATAAVAAVPMAIAIPEAMVMPLPIDRAGGIRGSSPEVGTQAAKADALLVGPGLSPTPSTQRLVRALLARAPRTVVLDAGALQMAAVKARGRETAAVLTPHLGEMAALLDVDVAQVESAAQDIAQAFAKRWGVVLVLKGATTHIGLPSGAVWINTGGSVGLGTSGSGDVLAGIIAGLAARGADAATAALWGVHLHAEAGARLSRRFGAVGFLAREISGEVPALLASG